MDRIFRDLGGRVLGIVPDNLEEREGGPAVAGLVEYLLELRQEAREAREWNRADAIRSRLTELGILIEDGPDDTTWRLV
jgi:cysteinyl-tRNA synthetase